MANFEQFMKHNKAVKSNTFFPATKSLTDTEGNPLKWEIRPISSRINSELRDGCMIDVPIPGKPNTYRQKLKTKEYIAKLLVESIVYPDLLDSALQDSYGVKKPEDLLYAMIDDPGEFDALTVFVQDFNGFSKSFEDTIEEAKN